MTGTNRQEVTVCNGCGANKPTSREHLIHRSIGQVLLNKRGLSTEEVRKRLNSGYWSRLFQRRPDMAPERDVRLDHYVTGFICEECNGGWANDSRKKPD